MRSRSILTIAVFLALVVLAIVPRVLFLADWGRNFDGDEALVGLTTMQLGHGDLHLYLPGSSYMGAVERLTAAPFALLSGGRPWAFRLAPLLWWMAGLIILLHWFRRESPEVGGWGTAIWGALWATPPAAAYLAGLKAWGGSVEGMVLGIWGVLLAWPDGRRQASQDARREAMPDALPAFCRYGFAGLLLGLALWSHDQSALLLPPAIAVTLAARKRSWTRILGLAAGFAVGHVPLWLPRLAAGALPAPGIQSSGWTPSLSALANAPRALAAVLWAPIGAGAPVFSTVPGSLLFVLLYAGGGYVVYEALRKRSSLSERPLFYLLLWLAAATVGALLVSPDFLEDPLSYRYTLGLGLFLLYACARTLSGRPVRSALPALVVVCVLSLRTYGGMHAAWSYPAARERKEMVDELSRRGITRVRTDWHMAYLVMLLSHERILCYADMPPRYPEDNAAVEYSPETWTLAPRDPSSVATGSDAPLETIFRLERSSESPPDSFLTAWKETDLRRTCFLHYEPWPVLRPGAYRRDWKGWPYRRPLDRFDTLVWESSHADWSEIAPGTVESSLDGLLGRGEFRVAASWKDIRILRRVRGAGGAS